MLILYCVIVIRYCIRYDYQPTQAGKLLNGVVFVISICSQVRTYDHDNVLDFRWKLDLHRWIRHLPPLPWSSLLLCSSCDKYLLATSNQPHYLLKARVLHISLQAYHHPALQSFYIITCSTIMIVIMIMHDYDYAIMPIK